MRGGLPIRTCTPVQSEPSDKSSIVDAHRRISRRRSVNCYRGAGEVIKTFFLVLDAKKGGTRVNKGSLGVDQRMTWTLPARLTGLALLESLSPVHLCRQYIVDAVEVTAGCITRAAAWLLAITFL